MWFLKQHSVEFRAASVLGIHVTNMTAFLSARTLTSCPEICLPLIESKNSM